MARPRVSRPRWSSCYRCRSSVSSSAPACKHCGCVVFYHGEAHPRRNLPAVEDGGVAGLAAVIRAELALRAMWRKRDQNA